jgi:Zn finger protein HypA/HybF involved in hydrogenase expression
VTDVYLDVGDESGIDPESVELHWPLLSEGSVAEGAVLHFNASEAPFTFRLTSIEVDEPTN